MRILVIKIGSSTSVRILSAEEYGKYSAANHPEEKVLISYGFTPDRDPEVVQYVEKLLLEDKKLRDGVIRLLYGMFVDTRQLCKDLVAKKVTELVFGE